MLEHTTSLGGSRQQSNITYASIINQEIQARFLFHESFRPILHASEILQVHFEHMEVEWSCAGCLHLVYSLL